MVTVEDAGEVIETIMVDESVDVPISVSGEDSPVPVGVVDESIPVDTVVDAIDNPSHVLKLVYAILHQSSILRKRNGCYLSKL